MVIPAFGVTFSEVGELWTKIGAIGALLVHQVLHEDETPQNTEEAIADLTDRVRHPLLWKLRNPKRAIRRTFGGR